MDSDLEKWFAEYERLNDELYPFFDRITAKRVRCGDSSITEIENVLEDLNYFLQAALINNGDVFGYVWHMIEHKKALEAIGAKGCSQRLRS